MALFFYYFKRKKFLLNMTSRENENLKLIVIMVYTSILEYVTCRLLEALVACCAIYMGDMVLLI